MHSKMSWKPWAGAAGAIAAGFGVSALSCNPKVHSTFQPPSWVFPIVWTTLFGIQGSLVVNEAKVAYVALAILALEYAWSFVYCKSVKGSTWLMIPIVGLSLYLLSTDSTLAHVAGAATASWVIFAQQLLTGGTLLPTKQ